MYGDSPCRLAISGYFWWIYRETEHQTIKKVCPCLARSDQRNTARAAHGNVHVTQWWASTQTRGLRPPPGPLRELAKTFDAFDFSLQWCGCPVDLMICEGVKFGAKTCQNIEVLPAYSPNKILDHGSNTTNGPNGNKHKMISKFGPDDLFDAPQGHWLHLLRHMAHGRIVRHLAHGCLVFPKSREGRSFFACFLMPKWLEPQDAHDAHT